MTKRIQSSLKVMKQSSLSELTCATQSLDSINRENLASNDVIEQKGATLVGVPEALESQGSPSSSDQQCVLSQSSNDVKPRGDLVPTSDNVQLYNLSFPTSESLKKQLPQSVAQGSMSALSGSVSVVGKLARSLSECDRKALISQVHVQLKSPQPVSSLSDIELSRAIAPGLVKGDIPQSTCTSVDVDETSKKNTVPTSPFHNKQSLVGVSVDSRREMPAMSTCVESTSVEVKRKETKTSTEENTLDEEQKALTLLVERKKEEEIVAQLSRERMNSMLSGEEITEVRYSYSHRNVRVCVHIHTQAIRT